MNDIARALDQTHAFLTRYVVFPLPEQADAVALWIGHTWVYDQFDTTPYLAIQSPEKRSGKSRLMECTGQLARQPVPMSGASLAACSASSTSATRRCCWTRFATGTS